MRILYATDGSTGAQLGGRLLAALPLAPDCRLSILSVASEGTPTGAALDQAFEALRHSPATLSREVRKGIPTEEILRAADELRADLIVLGSHGRSATARFLTGSTAERVARQAHCPVLLARGTELRRVCVGLDGSAGAAAAAEWLRDFPLPPECEVRLAAVIPNLHAVALEHFALLPPLGPERTTLDEFERVQARGHLESMVPLFAGVSRCVTEIRSGDPAPGLLEIAADEGADLLVVGSHGHTALERVLLGSVSEAVLRRAPCSVLLVRRPARVTEPRLIPDLAATAA